MIKEQLLSKTYAITSLFLVSFVIYETNLETSSVRKPNNLQDLNIYSKNYKFPKGALFLKKKITISETGSGRRPRKTDVTVRIGLADMEFGEFARSETAGECRFGGRNGEFL